MSPRILSIGILWAPDLTSPTTSGSDLPYFIVVADAYSRLQRAVSVPENALCFFQRSIRGSVSRRYPIIPLLEISVRKISLSVTFTPLQELSHFGFVCDNVSLHYQRERALLRSLQVLILLSFRQQVCIFCTALPQSAQVNRIFKFLIILPDFHCIKHFQKSSKVLFLFRCFIMNVSDKS